MRYPDYPFTSEYSMVNGNRMHYLDEGKDHNEPLVMLHGNPSWSFFFRKPVLTLRESYRCIVPDHVGMGLSDRPGENIYGYSLLDRINDLDALLSNIGIMENITLVLHDWGGMIGMGYACRHPDRISRLILMNTAAFLLPGGMQLPWQLRLARGPLGPVLVRGFNLFCRGAVRQCVSRKPLSNAVAAAYLAPYNNWSRRLAVLRFIQDIPLHEGDQSYAPVTAIDKDIGQFRNTPMLLCWGLQDFVFTEAFYNEWKRRFPRSEALGIKDAGHYVLEDAPEEVTDRIESFLAHHRTAG